MSEGRISTIAKPPGRRASDAGRSRLADLTRPIAREQRIATRRRPAFIAGARRRCSSPAAIGAALFGLPVRTWFGQDDQIRHCNPNWASWSPSTPTCRTRSTGCSPTLAPLRRHARASTSSNLAKAVRRSSVCRSCRRTCPMAGRTARWSGSSPSVPKRRATRRNVARPLGARSLAGGGLHRADRRALRGGAGLRWRRSARWSVINLRRPTIRMRSRSCTSWLSGRPRSPPTSKPRSPAELRDEVDVQFADERDEAVDEDVEDAPVLDDGVLVAVGELPPDTDPVDRWR